MKSLFYDDPEIIYLNSGTQSKPLKALITKANKLRQEAYRNPVQIHANFPSCLKKSHIALASFLNTHPNDLFFTHNVTESLNHFILGTKLSKKAELLISDMEYGATYNICRFKSEQENRPMTKVSLSSFFKNKAINEEILNAKIIKKISLINAPRGSLFILSHVFTSNGFIVPILKIADILKRKGIFLAIDGAHAIGAFSCDFSKFHNIAFYGGNLHKWMMGLSGTAFGWINPKIDLKTESLFIGWPSYGHAKHLKDFSLKGSAKKFFIKGTIDFAPFMIIPDLIHFWKMLKPSIIFEKRKELRLLAIQLLSENPFLELNSYQAHLGPLLSFKIRSQQISNDLANILYQNHRLIVSTPKKQSLLTLRISPNIYNTNLEIKKACQIINTYLK